MSALLFIAIIPIFVGVNSDHDAAQNRNGIAFNVLF